MNAQRLLAAVGIAALMAAGAARAETITFDDIPTHDCCGGDSQIVSPYAGFNWNDVYVGSANDGLGFANGVVSPSHDAYNGFNALASFSTVSGDFTLDSFDLTAAFGPEQVNFTGYLNGVQVDAVSLAAVETGPTLYTLNWTNIDTVTFQGVSGHAVLDNITVSEAAGGVPEPATWALMISGFGLAGAALRRRRSAIA